MVLKFDTKHIWSRICKGIVISFDNIVLALDQLAKLTFFPATHIRQPRSARPPILLIANFIIRCDCLIRQEQITSHLTHNDLTQHAPVMVT